MKAYKISSPRKLEIFSLEMPEISESEVLLKVLYCGICASEIHEWEKPSYRRPVLGHEVVAVVEQVGSAVSKVVPGDRVTGMIYAGFAEYTKCHEDLLVKIPDPVKSIDALGEPLSCLVSAADRTPFPLGTSVAIIGTGFMGLGLLQLLRLKGAGKIIAIDIRPESLKLAKEMGANETYTPDAVPEKYKVNQWNDRMFLDGIPVVAEVTGTQPGLNLATEMVGVHGHLSIVGYHASNGGQRQVNVGMCNWKAFDICNAHERRDQVHIAAQNAVMSLLANGRFRMDKLVTHVFDFEQLNQAFTSQVEKPEGFIKAVVRINP